MTEHVHFILTKCWLLIFRQPHITLIGCRMLGVPRARKKRTFSRLVFILETALAWLIFILSFYVRWRSVFHANWSGGKIGAKHQWSTTVLLTSQILNKTHYVLRRVLINECVVV